MKTDIPKLIECAIALAISFIAGLLSYYFIKISFVDKIHIGIYAAFLIILISLFISRKKRLPSKKNKSVAENEKHIEKPEVRVGNEKLFIEDILDNKRNILLWRSIQTLEEIKDQINTTKNDIHAFQLSGKYNTSKNNSNLKKWLEKRGNRKLRLMYIDPDNLPLVESVGILTGRIKAEPCNFKEYKAQLIDYRDEIIGSIKLFNGIKKSLNNSNQIKLKVYSSAPAASIFASDINEDIKEKGSIFVEHYLFKGTWEQRLCFHLKEDEKNNKELYEKYRQSINYLWESGREIAVDDVFKKPSFLWADVDKAFTKIKRYVEDFNPEVIIGLADGRIVGGIIAQNLRINEFFGIDIPVCDNNRNFIPPEGRTIYGKFSDVTGKRVLLVDNHVFTGANMELAKGYIAKYDPADLKTLVFFKSNLARFQPDFIADEFDVGLRMLMPWSYTKKYRTAYCIADE